MSDWIERLKNEDDETAKATEMGVTLRLHEAKVVTAKAPAFWQDLCDRLQQYSYRLRETFPRDNERQCSVTTSGNSCLILGQKAPFTALDLTLNLNGMCLDARWDSGDRKREPPTRSNSSFKFQLDDTEEVFVVQGNQNYADPAHLAEYLIRRVCNMKG